MLVLTPDAADLVEAAERENDRLRVTGFAPDTVRDIQRGKLDALWARVSEVPYYADLPAVRQRDLASMPLTRKDTVKADPFAFVRASATISRYYETSGSTGVPTATPRTSADMVWNAAAVAAVWSRTLLPGERVACLVPSDVAPVGDLVVAVAETLGCPVLRAYPFAQGICDWDRLEHLFATYAPQHVFVAPGVLSQWTRLLKQRGSLAAVSAPVRGLELLGEVSTPALRSQLGRAWSARAIDVSYGSTETGTIAAACEHDRQHLLLTGHLLELWDGAQLRPATPGARGELVTTTLNNHARPLVRFATGDMVTIGEGCPCGLPLPTVTVHGRRSEDVTIGGRTLSPQDLEATLYQVDGVTGYLVQLRKPAGEQARLVVEMDVDFTGDAVTLADAVAARFADAGIRWDGVVAVRQLPATTKAGGSQKNWKRTNVTWVD